jgi:hypothetical protein
VSAANAVIAEHDGAWPPTRSALRIQNSQAHIFIGAILLRMYASLSHSNLYHVFGPISARFIAVRLWCERSE